MKHLHGIELHGMKINEVIKVVDTLRINSGQDAELTTSADNAFHAGIDPT